MLPLEEPSDLAILINLIYSISIMKGPKNIPPSPQIICLNWLYPKSKAHFAQTIEQKKFVNIIDSFIDYPFLFKI